MGLLFGYYLLAWYQGTQFVLPRFGLPWIDQLTATRSPSLHSSQSQNLENKKIAVTEKIEGSAQKSTEKAKPPLNPSTIIDQMPNAIPQKPKTAISNPELPGKLDITPPYPILSESDNSSTMSPLKLALPSGARLTEAMLEVSNGWQEELFPKNAIVYVAKYPNNKIQGIFTLKKAKLNGAAASLYENGNIQTLVFYKEADLHGPMRQWNENGEWLFYAKFNHGKKHGLACLFQNGTPWLIQEYDKGIAQNNYLVKWTQSSAIIVPTEQLTSDENFEMSEALQQLDTLEETMKKNETILKQQLAEWYREEDQRVKQERINKQASERIVSHNAQKAMAEELFWRNALMNAPPIQPAYLPNYIRAPHAIHAIRVR